MEWEDIQVNNELFSQRFKNWFPIGAIVGAYFLMILDIYFFKFIPMENPDYGGPGVTFAPYNSFFFSTTSGHCSQFQANIFAISVIVMSPYIGVKSIINLFKHYGVLDDYPVLEQEEKLPKSGNKLNSFDLEYPIIELNYNYLFSSREKNTLFLVFGVLISLNPLLYLYIGYRLFKQNNPNTSYTPNLLPFILWVQSLLIHISWFIKNTVKSKSRRTLSFIFFIILSIWNTFILLLLNIPVSCA